MPTYTAYWSFSGTSSSYDRYRISTSADNNYWTSWVDEYSPSDNVSGTVTTSDTYILATIGDIDVGSSYRTVLLSTHPAGSYITSDTTNNNAVLAEVNGQYLTQDINVVFTVSPADTPTPTPTPTLTPTPTPTLTPTPTPTPTPAPTAHDLIVYNSGFAGDSLSIYINGSLVIYSDDPTTPISMFGALNDGDLVQAYFSPSYLGGIYVYSEAPNFDIGDTGSGSPVQYFAFYVDASMGSLNISCYE